MELPIGEHATLYSFGGVTHRDGRAAGFYRLPRQTNSVVPELYPNGFLPEIHSHIDDLSMTAGVRTRRQGWDVDLSLSHGQNQFQFNVEHTNNASLGTRSPTSFDAGRLSSAETTLDLDLLREIETAFLQRLAFVAGSEFRLERYRIGAGEPASYELGDVMGKLPGGATGSSAAKCGGKEIVNRIFAGHLRLSARKTRWANYVDVRPRSGSTVGDKGRGHSITGGAFGPESASSRSTVL